MFDFNSEEKILNISKIPLPKTETEYQVSEMFESYERYRTVGIKEDIENILVPLLNKALSGSVDKTEIWSDGVTVTFDNVSNYKGYEYYSAFLKLDGFQLTNVAKPFCVFKIPVMDKYGLIKKDGKQYALLAEMVQDDDITYNSKELKIITKKGCYINLNWAAKGPRMTYRKKAISAIEVMFLLANQEGINGADLYKKIVNKDAWNVYKNDRDLDIAAMFAGGTDIVRSFVEALKTEAYDLSSVRDRMNAVLSIDRAIGETLSRDVTLSNGEVIQTDTVLNASDIAKMKLDMVNEVYVQDTPNMIGYFTAEPLLLPIIRRGTAVSDVIKAIVPEITGAYVSKTITFPRGKAPIIPENTPVTEGFIEMLAYNGHTELKLKNSETSDSIVNVPLERSIVGNRHFRECDLRISNSTHYVYVNPNGEIEEAKTSLCAYDVAALMSLFDRLCKNLDTDMIADRDLGLRKKVNLAEESFHRAFAIAAPEFVRMISRKLQMRYRDQRQIFADPDEMEAMFFKLSQKWWTTLYTKLKLVQRIEMYNPVSFYSSFAKINSIVKDKNAISESQHGLSMGHYGRLCPYETPSGKTMGTVNNRAVGCKIENGIMKTSYYKIKKLGKTAFIDFNKVWLTVEEEERCRIADITSLRFDPKTGRITNTKRVFARVPSTSTLEKMTTSYVDVLQLDYVNTDPQQTDSLTATTVPFEGGNDSPRVIFGLSMVKQAKGLVNPEVPLVLTSGFINIPRKSPYYMVQAEHDGIVLDAYPGVVVVQYNDKPEPVEYTFEMKEFSKEAVIIRNILVEPDQIVKAGEILVESNFVKDGYLAIGANCLVGYACQGSNYEDGIYGSERLEQKMMSYGSNSEEEKISKEYKYNRIGYVNKFRYNTPGNVVCTLHQSTNSQTISRPIRSKHLKGFIVDAKVEQDKFSNRDTGAVLNSVSNNTLNRGDKLANRHGNKGVVPKITSNADMPLFANGEFLDICYNPMGVSSRMNLGQVLECHLGLACYVLGIKARSDSFNGAQEGEIKLLLSYAWHLANDLNPESVVNRSEFAVLPKALHDYCLGRIELIRAWKGSFNEDGTAWMFNPRTGRYFEEPMLVGVNYVYKLLHESAKKVHGRGGLCTEPYVAKLSAPTHGQAKSGGQRMGYMEFDALLAYGAVNYVHELQNERGDNAVARNNLTVSALHKGNDYMLPESTAIRRSTEMFVNIAESLGVSIDFEGELPNNTKSSCAARKVYRVNSLIKATEVSDESADSCATAEEFEDALSKFDFK